LGTTARAGREGLKGTTLFASPGHNQIPSLPVMPQAMTKDNLNVALDAGWTTKADLCRDVDPAKEPPACR